MTDDGDLDHLDRLIRQTSNVIDLLANVSPTQESLKREKRRFLRGTIDEPAFEYEPLGYDPDHIEERLESASATDTPIGRLYRKTIDELIRQNTLLANRGDPDTVRETTTAIYGRPTDRLVQQARTILKESTPEEQDDDLPLGPDEARIIFDDALEAMGLDDWRTAFSAKNTVSVKAAEKTIQLPDHRRYRKGEPERLVIHELLHAARSANGYRQDHDIFGIGVAGYYATDEGLATFLEKETGHNDHSEQWRYAALVLVSHSVIEGRSFRDTFQILHDNYGIDEETAFKQTARGYRSGGFAKDHIYLQGHLEVRDYIEDGNTLDDLYKGKIAIKDVKDGTLDEIGGLKDHRYDHRALHPGLDHLFEDTGDG